MGGNERNEAVARDADVSVRIKLDESWILCTSDFPLSSDAPTPFAVTRHDPAVGRSETAHGIVVTTGSAAKMLIFVFTNIPSIRIEAVRQPRGGVRWRFVCPTTGALCDTIIRAPGAIDFVSRTALGRVSYPSQRRSPRRRAADRAAKIRVALGGSPDLASPFPERPARMHRATHARRRTEAEAATIIALTGRALPSLHLEPSR